MGQKAVSIVILFGTDLSESHIAIFIFIFACRSQCLMHNITDWDWDVDDNGTYSAVNHSHPVPCSTGWWYSNEYYTTTIVSDVRNAVFSEVIIIIFSIL